MGVAVRATVSDRRGYLLLGLEPFARREEVQEPEVPLLDLPELDCLPLAIPMAFVPQELAFLRLGLSVLRSERAFLTLQVRKALNRLQETDLSWQELESIPLPWDRSKGNQPPMWWSRSGLPQCQAFRGDTTSRRMRTSKSRAERKPP
jgi:hypothetical protein